MLQEVLRLHKSSNVKQHDGKRLGINELQVGRRLGALSTLQDVQRRPKNHHEQAKRLTKVLPSKHINLTHRQVIGYVAKSKCHSRNQHAMLESILPNHQNTWSAP